MIILANDKTSTARFKINAYLRLAEMVDPDDKAQRQFYIDEATSLLETIIAEPTGSIERTANYILAEKAIKKIAEKSNELKWMTVSDFCKQDSSFPKIHCSYIGRVLSEMGYTQIRKHRLGNYEVQRERLLPYINND